MKQSYFNSKGRKISRLNFAAALTFFVSLFGLSLNGQVFNVPQSGTDTVTNCVGIFNDPGGNAYYPSYSDGILIIDPPGNATVNVQFTSFNTYNYSDWVRIYDGVGTNGTLLGSYSGSSLPNGGSAITSTSGAITIRFYSNCCSQSTGFQGSFTTNASTSPSASFVPSSTSPAYNTPVQFINTTTNGGSYVWDFGDGQTSTDLNPSHSYTSSGLHHVKLIATNCAGNDTSNIVSINVQAAPQGAVSVDTLKISTACGTSNSGSLTVSNSGSGNLSYNSTLQAASNMIQYRENFENGKGLFVESSGTTYNLSSTGGVSGSAYLGLQSNGYMHAQVPTSTPGNIKYNVKTDSYNSYHGEVEIGSGNSNNYYNLFYSTFRYYNMYLYYLNSSGYISYYLHPISQGQWYEVELRNIDWSNRTYDIYVDNVLLVQGAGIISNQVNSIDYISFNNNYYANSGLDAIEFGGINASGIFTYNPVSGNLSSGSNNVVFFNANASNLNAGVYYFDLILSSNDTALDGKIVPIELTVTGDALFTSNKNCSAFGSIFSGISYSDSVFFSNTGCDTLNFSTITTTNTDITLSSSSLDLAPGDSISYSFNFTPSAVGSVTDTIFFNGPDTNFVYCIGGSVSGAPSIILDSTSYTVNHTGCTDSAQLQIIIGNNGLDTLNWTGSGTGQTQLSDDFENGLNNSIWSSTGNTITTSSSCGVISGNSSLTFTGSYIRRLTTVPLNLLGGGVISFDIQSRGTCEHPDYGEGVYLEYSVNNGTTWNQIGYHYQSTYSVTSLSYVIPQAAQTTNTLIRLDQRVNSGSNIDNWLLDNFSIQGSFNYSALIFSPDTGNIAVSGSDTVDVYIDVNGLIGGTHTFIAFFNSNDPSNPSLAVPITLNLTGIPNLVVPSACHQLDSTIMGSSSIDSVLIFNDGCGLVDFTSITNTNNILSISNPPDSLLPGDSTYIQLNFAPVNGPMAFTDTIVFNQAGGITSSLCVNSYIKGAPALSIDSSAINVTINGCNDSVNVQRWIHNTGLTDGEFKLSGGSAYVPLQELLDTFKTSYSSITSLIPNNYNFYDGIYGNGISDGGGDMYDGGNYLSISSGGFPRINYSNDQITAYPAMGQDGEYFTYKGNGIFLFAANIDNVNDFNIRGNLGADGSGLAEVGMITSQLNGQSYTGYFKKVHSAWDPSVNHLIITETNANINRTYSTYTDSDNHILTGLQGNKRIYYILFAGSSGANYQNGVFQDVMDEFISLLETNNLPEWVSVNPDSGNVSQNDSVLLDIWVKSGGLATGNHTGSIIISTNDPLNSEIAIPVNLTIVGQAEVLSLQNTCVSSFSNIQQGATALDSAFVTNIGCDTLFITQVTSQLPEFGVTNLPLTILPGDTVPVMINFTPTTVGSFADTLVFSSSDTIFNICVNATSVGAPLLNLPSDTIRYTLNKCKIIGNETFRIENQGLGAMNYSLSIGGYLQTSHQTYNTSGAQTTHNFTGVPAASSTDTLELRIILHGDYDDYSERSYLNIESSWNYGYLNDNNKFYVNDTIYIKTWGSNVQTWTSDGNFSITLSNLSSVDGNSGSFHEVQLRLTSQVNWVSVTGATSGTLASSAGVNKNLLFNAANLAVGTYNTNLNITNNSPGAPFVMVPIILDVVSEADIQTTDTCLNFPLTLLGDTAIANFSLYNDGCNVLNITNITSTNGIFEITPSVASAVQIDDSIHYTVRFIPTAVGNFSASLIISNNDEPITICLDGISGAKPVAQFSFSPENVCLGEVSFQDGSTYNPSSWSWDFGDGNTSNSQNPSHFYEKPGTYKVRLTVQNGYGIDTIHQMVTASPLYVDFSYSTDTVDLHIDPSISFHDSTLTASLWNWNFGDGNTSTIQNPSHTYTQTGKMTVKLIATDSRGCQREKEATIYVINSIGIDESSTAGFHIQQYPNPSTGIFNLEIVGVNQSELRADVYDMAGKLVLSKNGLSEMEKLDLSLFENGVYSLIIFHEGEKLYNKNLVLNR